MSILGSVLFLLAAGIAPRPAELILERALPVDGLPNAEPSGLVLCGGDLYTVSDNHDKFIYRLKLESERAVLEPAVPIAIPEGVRGDLEGVVCDERGDFYLACEAQFRILHVSHDGKQCDWVTPSLRDAGEKAGLFKISGGYFEGLERIDAQHWVLCAERQPRGIVDVDLAGGVPSVSVQILNEPTIQPRGLRFPDFTDLCRFDGAEYVLERNAEIVSVLHRDGKRITVTPWRSFRETLTKDEFRYADERFGMAEGLAMDKERVYVILDNNGVARVADKNDHRPMLFVFRMP